MSDHTHEPDDRAEPRLRTLLDLLASEELEPSSALADDVVHSARWQRRARGVALGLGAVAAAAAGAIAVMFGLRGRR